METDISFAGFGVGWGHHRTYAQILDEEYTGPNGANWFISDIPRLYGVGGGSAMLVYSKNLTLYFTKVSDTVWASSFNTVSQLRYDPVKHEYVLTDRNGGGTLFFDQTVSGRIGMFKGLRNPVGDEFLTEYVSDRITSISRVVNSKVSGIFYTYVAAGSAGAGLLASVTLRISDADVRRVSYAYYANGDFGGSEHDLKAVVIEQLDTNTSAWSVIGRTFYRYYVAGEASGFVHGLKFVLHSESLARLTAAGLSPETATDAQLAGFADFRFYYDTAKRVVREDVAAGTYSHTFAYHDSNVVNSIWSIRTTETLPDGAQNIVYTNGWNQAVFRIYRKGADEWYAAYAVDFDGNYVAEYSSAAIQSYDETTARLFVPRDNEGLVRRWSYYYDPVGNTAPNNALEAERICKGGSTLGWKTKGYEYTRRNTTESAVWVPWKQHTYLDDGLTPSAATTTFEYTWFANSLQMETRTTILPVVATGQNGSGAAVTQAELFDVFGRSIWSRDERGFLTAYVKDSVTGALSRRIDDVNTTILPCPAGWTTPSGGGLHLISDFERDFFGREIASYGPEHDIDHDGVVTRIRRAAWTVYRDTQFETWSASGFVTGVAPNYAVTVVNPVSIMRTDHDGRVLDEIVAVRLQQAEFPHQAKVETVGRLNSASDSFPQETWIRWTSSHYDQAYRIAWRRLYFDIPTNGDGMPGFNYGQTDFGYDAAGRNVRQRTPGGTITRTVYYGPSWNKQSWVGTDDTGATAAQPSAAAPNNMTLISEREYDNNADGGNGNVTTVLAWPTHEGTPDPRVTVFIYDWRDRRIVTHAEPMFHEFYTYDFRSQITATERRESVSPTGTLLMRSTADFDVLGRTWKRSVFSVVSGTVGNSISELFWYDASSNMICRRSLTGNSFEKSAFDSVGRLERSATTVRTGLPTYAQAANLDADTVTEQTKFYYDAAGNLIKKRHRERNHNATGTGNLKGPNDGQPAARTLYTCAWPDGVGRTVVSANYGTNGGEKVDRPDLIPASTPLCLVSETRYNARGEAYASVDPAGKVDKQEYDDAGRLVKTVENYQP